VARTVDSKRLRPAAVADAVATVVQRGGTVIFPTDTVYGIGCDPVRGDAVEAIFALKGRPRTKPLALYFGSVAEMLEYAPENPLAAALAREFLPGPLTVVVRRPSYVHAFVTAGLPSVGLRVPNHDLCRRILERCGPLAATSANFSGEPAFDGTSGAVALPAADLRVDDGPTPLGVESTVIDVCGEVALVVREGAISVAMLQQVVGRIERPNISGASNGESGAPKPEPGPSKGER
jgi:L-threonylcarbamoyladenylate synthase